MKTYSANTECVLQDLHRGQGMLSLRDYAKLLGISAPYLCDIYLGRRLPGPKVLKPLGYEKMMNVTIAYRRKVKRAARAWKRRSLKR
jgi:hypothetical protein